MKTTTCVVGAGLFLGVLGLSLAAVQQDTSAQSNRTIRVDVDLVLANVTVTDSRSRFVEGLEKKHFRIFEDKVEQEILTFGKEDAPVSLGVIFDRSGSMEGQVPKGINSERYSSLLDEIKASAYSCLKTGLREDEYFLIEFSDRPAVVTDFTNDMTRLKERIVFTGAGGKTALWDAIYAGVAKVQQGLHPRKALLVLTDGLENNSRYTLSNLKAVLREQDVRIYSTYRDEVAIDGLTQLAELSGGRIFKTGSPCKELASELRNQYIIGYRSTNRSRDGEFRRINVRINSDTVPKGVSGLTVRARAGYYAAP